MKSQLVVRKYMQGLAIPSVLQHVFKICISHKTIPKSVLNINSSRPPSQKKRKKTKYVASHKMKHIYVQREQ